MSMKALNIQNMSARIMEREDNLYNKNVITDILKMYMDEVRKSLLRGERVQISKVGTIIPEVKVHLGRCYLPTCREMDENAPYARIRMTRNDKMRKDMNQTLWENMENGIYGLEERLFDTQQIHILQKYGYLPKEEGTEED